MPLPALRRLSSFRPLPPARSLRSVKANSPGIELRVNPEAADRSGGFHWDVSAGYYEVRVSVAGCHAPGSGATTVASPVFPIPPPKVGLTLVLACSGERPVPMPTVSSVVPGRRRCAGWDHRDHQRDRVQPLGGEGQVRGRPGAAGDLPFARSPYRRCACRLGLPVLYV